MGIERSNRPMAATRMTAIAHELLDASTLCAIATVAPGGHAHINTAYFAWSPQFDLVWISEPRAKHSANIRANDSAAVAIYDSSQSWGKPDRGIQLFGTAGKAEGVAADDAEAVYAKRFPDYRQRDLSAYHLYVFRPRRLKIFDECTLGTGVFVTGTVTGKRRLAWERTEIYHSAA
jgi:uncharacterized protein YhbP (UPF0306 family)